MNIDVQDFRLLETIESAGSFSAAATQLSRTRSAITQHIKKLEDQVGFQIFDRSSYRPAFTSEGYAFLERGRLLLRNLERLKSDIQYIKEGWENSFWIAINDIIPSENIYFLIEAFRKTAPSVTIGLTREVLNGCWDALAANRVSLGIGVTGEPPPGFLFDQRPLGDVEFVFVVAKDHPLTKIDKPISSWEVQAYPNIVISDTSRTLEQRSSGLLFSQPKIIVPTMEAKIHAQVQGLGVGYLPRSRIFNFFKEGQLVEVALETPTKHLSSLKIAWPAHSQSPSLAWFLEALHSPQVRQRVVEGKNTYPT